MITSRNRILILFVDRTSRQWVVKDGDGNYWAVPANGESWEQRQPFFPADNTELEQVPGHYKSMLGLPW